MLWTLTYLIEKHSKVLTPEKDTRFQGLNTRKGYERFI
jgi:hypothetical protein